MITVTAKMIDGDLRSFVDVDPHLEYPKRELVIIKMNDRRKSFVLNMRFVKELDIEVTK